MFVAKDSSRVIQVCEPNTFVDFNVMSVFLISKSFDNLVGIRRVLNQNRRRTYFYAESHYYSNCKIRDRKKRLLGIKVGGGPRCRQRPKLHSSKFE